MSGIAIGFAADGFGDFKLPDSGDPKLCEMCAGAGSFEAGDCSVILAAAVLPAPFRPPLPLNLETPLACDMLPPPCLLGLFVFHQRKELMFC